MHAKSATANLKHTKKQADRQTEEMQLTIDNNHKSITNELIKHSVKKQFGNLLLNLAVINRFSDKSDESEKHPFSDKFDIRLNPSTTGTSRSCQFESLSDQLSTIGIMISHEELRSTVVSLLADNPLTSDGTHFTNFTSLEWDVYWKNMSGCSTYGDHVTLMAAAKLYDVNLVIVSSLGNQFNRVISAGSTNDDSCPVQ